MQMSILLFKQIAQLFLMILMGYIIVKTKLLKGEDSKVLSKIILYLIIPAVIINAFQVDYSSNVTKGLITACIASIILHSIHYPAVFTTLRNLHHAKNVPPRLCRIHIRLLLKLRKPDRPISYLYIRR